MKKVLIILEAGKAYPSGITRGIIYKDLFKKHGYICKFVNRNSPYLLKIINHSPFFLSFLNHKIIAFFAHKLLSIYIKLIHWYIKSISKSYDLIYMSKVLDFDLIHHLKAAKSRRIVYDFGDSVWLFNSCRRFNEVLSMVDVVTTDNSYVADYVKKFNKNCYVIPDYPQLNLFEKERKTIKKRDDKIIIGWIGSPTTVFNLNLIWEVLHTLFLKYDNIHLRLIGVGHNTYVFPNYKYIDFSTVSFYDQKAMIEEVLRMDIGLFPLQNIEASTVRGVLKASIYMSGGVPVVGSAIGELNDFIEDGENGYLARNDAEWFNKIESLIKDKELRLKIGNRGLETIREKFSLEDNFKKLITTFET